MNNKVRINNKELKVTKSLYIQKLKKNSKFFKATKRIKPNVQKNLSRSIKRHYRQKIVKIF